MITTDEVESALTIWRAFWRGIATEEEVRSKFHGVTWLIHKPKGFMGRMRMAIFGDRREG